MYVHIHYTILTLFSIIGTLGRALRVLAAAEQPVGLLLWQSRSDAACVCVCVCGSVRQVVPPDLRGEIPRPAAAGAGCIANHIIHNNN